MRFLLPFLVLAIQPAPDPGAQLYSKVVRSTVWIHSKHDQGMATGSGSLIDRRRLLVLTNYHVVGENDHATVVFPGYREGKLVAERGDYNRQLPKIEIKGRVIARDKQHDLALIQIESAPDGTPALPMAENSPSPGQTVHSIGNPGGSGALWVYTPGKVRQVYHKRWKAKLDNQVAEFDGTVVETDSPTNPGDSGGPLVDDHGELVGVTQGGALNANLMSTFIDVSEVKRFLNKDVVRKVTGFDGKITDRTTALTMHDAGKFFSPATVTKANETAQTLYRKTGRDLVVETYETVPQKQVEEMKSMKPEERSKYFRDWAAARAKAQDVNGMLLLVCRNPSSFHLYVSDRKHDEIVPKLTDTIRTHFKNKQFDEGLQEFIKLASEDLSK